ncbi:hypothetical protein [Nocardioides sp.]|uniref:hypothetical protein n=1 Tax=Nocardioides sp. TaxID=35761 RepID=UPI002728D713|nr:hypothetical protein [Nocardioides sp.]MDO9455654.1 hypothetical protein [Nocardioides sp.]
MNLSFGAFGIFFLVVLGIIVLSAVASAAGRRRRAQGMAAYAAKREWRWSPDGTGLEHRLSGEPFGRGSRRIASNVVEGRYEGWAFVAFDYRYTTRSGDDSTVHRNSVVSMHLGSLAQSVPMLQVEPHGAVGRFFSELFGRGQPVGDPAFDKAFSVRTTSPELAHDVLHPDMRLMLASYQDRAWRFEGDSLLMFRRGEHSPAEIDQVLASMKAILDRVPPGVWDRLRGERPR